MDVTVPGCYDARTGQLATVSNRNEIVYPRQREGAPKPTPVKGAAEVFKAIAAITPQGGLK